MALDKSHTPVWMKVVIWVVAASFVAGGVIIAGAGTGSSKKTASTNGSSTTTDTASTIEAKYKPAIEAADTALKSTPASYELLVTQGNNYYDWAAALVNAGVDPTVSNPLFLTSASFYGKAIQANKAAAAGVWGDRSFALYYGGSSDAAAALQEFIKKDAKNSTGQVDTAKTMLGDLKTKASTDTTAK